jgi:hypothetical protein
MSRFFDRYVANFLIGMFVALAELALKLGVCTTGHITTMALSLPSNTDKVKRTYTTKNDKSQVPPTHVLAVLVCAHTHTHPRAQWKTCTSPLCGCGSVFAARAGYNRHIKVVKGDRVSCPHPDCDLTYAQPNTAALHAAQCHPEMSCPHPDDCNHDPRDHRWRRHNNAWHHKLFSSPAAATKTVQSQPPPLTDERLDAMRPSNLDGSIGMLAALATKTHVDDMYKSAIIKRHTAKVQALLDKLRGAEEKLRMACISHKAKQPTPCQLQ